MQKHDQLTPTLNQAEVQDSGDGTGLSMGDKAMFSRTDSMAAAASSFKMSLSALLEGLLRLFKVWEGLAADKRISLCSLEKSIWVSEVINCKFLIILQVKHIYIYIYIRSIVLGGGSWQQTDGEGER